VRERPRRPPGRRRPALELRGAAAAGGPASARPRARRRRRGHRRGKRSSPSKGRSTGLAAGAQAAAYAAGAGGLSILTEPTRFGGRRDDVHASDAANRGRVPVSRRTSTSTRPARRGPGARASAALLIARALAPTDLAAMERAARDLGLETLVEIRDERELDAALAADAR
jgi:indole-3-glycerol phosphate synthase